MPVMHNYRGAAVAAMFSNVFQCFSYVLRVFSTSFQCLFNVCPMFSRVFSNVVQCFGLCFPMSSNVLHVLEAPDTRKLKGT